MAQLGNLLVKGSSRFLNKAYFEDISIAGTSFFSDNISTDGTLNIGANKASNALLYLNKKIAIRGVDSWLRINDTSTNFTSGVYFGSSDVRTDKAFQVGDGGKYFKINSSSLDVNVPSVFSQRTTHNGGLISPTISSNLISFVKNGNTLPKIDGADATAILNELTVLSTLRAKEYELDHVQNLGGTFMVSPSFICTEGSTSVTVSAISDSEVTFVIKDNATLTKTEIATASWVLNSQIKLSGKIGNAILANATGTITKSVDTNNHTITVKVDVGSSTVGNFTVNTTYSGSQVSKLALMMFRNASGYRLGIYLESYSPENKKPVINIFDGSGTDPKVVLGKLDGTPKVNNVSPTGYGLYSDNAFLKGTIIATSGTIGGFTLSTNSIQNGTLGQDGSVMMCLGSNNSVSIGGSGNINGWTFTAGSKFGVTKNGAMYATSGKIGKYTITDSYLITGNNSTCTGIGGNQAFWAGSDSSNDAPFHVSYDGSLYASKADIYGKINATSGKIGKFSIDSYALITGNTDSTSAGIGADYVAFWTGSKDPTYAPFAVTYDGTLHTIKGDIGGWTIEKNAIYKEYNDFGVRMRADPENPLEFILIFNDKATSESGKKPFYIYSNGYMHASLGDIGGWGINNSSIYKGSGWKSSTSGSAYFGDEGLSITDKFWVDKTGNLFSNKGKIAGWNITSDSFYKDTDDYTVYVCPGTNNNKDFLTVHDKNKSSGDEWPFYVHADGWMHCVYGDIGGWNIGKNSINSSYSNTETTEYYVSDSFYSLSILSDSSKIISEFNEKKYSDSSKQKILSSESDSLTISGDSIQGTSRYILYGEETDKSGYSFLLSAYNGLEILDEVSEEGISYTGNHILFTRYNETVAEITEDKINSCHAGEVCHYYGNDYGDCGTNNDKYYDLSAFTTGGGQTFGSFHTKISNKKIKINRTGVYCFQVKFSVNSGVKGSADKRVEFVPFVNNTRQSRYAALFSSRGNFSITNFQTYILSLNKGDVIAFDISPIEKVSVRVQIVDISVHVLDYVNKYAYEYN